MPAVVNWLRCAALLALLATAVESCPPKFLDTGQSQLLAVEGSVGGSQVNLKNGVMSYCSNQTTIVCMITCTLTFSTIHSPRYYINGGFYSAARNSSDLQRIGAIATVNYPSHTIRFPCHAITDYWCVLNDTVCTQEIRMQPVACGTPEVPSPTTNTTPPFNSSGENVTNGTDKSVHPHPKIVAITAGVFAAAFFIIGFGIATIIGILLYVVVRYRHRLRLRGIAILRMVRSHFYAQNTDEGVTPIPVADDGRGGEMVPGVLPVDGGGGQQWPISITRPT